MKRREKTEGRLTPADDVSIANAPDPQVPIGTQNINNIMGKPRKGEQMRKLAACPYPPVITGEASGTEVPNDAFRYWCEGRNAQYCMEDGVSPGNMGVSGDFAKRIIQAAEEGQAMRAFQETFKRAATECAIPRVPLTIDPKDILEGACHISKWQGGEVCIAKEHGKLKIFEVASTQFPCAECAATITVATGAEKATCPKCGAEYKLEPK